MCYEDMAVPARTGKWVTDDSIPLIGILQEDGAIGAPRSRQRTTLYCSAFTRLLCFIADRSAEPQYHY
jgi:hypothetical protein